MSDAAGNGEFLRPYREAAEKGVLMLPRCVDCGRLHWYPRPACPHCGGAVTWVAASGDGTIYAVTNFRRGESPRLIAYVELAEGLRLLSVIEADDDAKARIGSVVRVSYRGTSEPALPVPFFRLVT